MLDVKYGESLLEPTLKKFSSREDLFLPKKLLHLLSPKNYVTNSIFLFAFAALRFGLKLMLTTIQLTLEQYMFELRESTYTQIFFNSKYYSTAQSIVG